MPNVGFLSVTIWPRDNDILSKSVLNLTYYKKVITKRNFKMIYLRKTPGLLIFIKHLSKTYFNINIYMYVVLLIF